MLQISKSPCTTSRLRIGMGTFIAVDAEASTDLGILSGIDAAFAAIALVEALMHPTRPGSDLVAIHQTELGTAVPIHAWTWEILMLSKRLNRASQGIFDPCLPEMAGRFIDLEFTAARCVIAHAPLRIDLGGIAKGYAVDRAVTALRAAGCHGGLVNAGGDLAVFGDRSHDIICRDASGRITVVALKNAALATSDVGNAAPPAEHRGYYRGIDRSEIESGRITVAAASAAIADGLTKCLLAGHGDASAALLETFGARVIKGPLHYRRRM